MSATKSVGAKNLGSSGILYSDRRDFYIRPNVVKELWTDVTPFLTVIANRATISGMADPTFKMFEHRNPWQKQKFQLAGEPASVASEAELGTAVAVDGFEGIVKGNNIVGLVCDVFDDASGSPTGDSRGQVLITSYEVDGGVDKIKYKNLTAGAIDAQDNDHFMIIGNAQGEGTNSPTAWSDDLSVVYNQCQIFKTPLEITGTLLEASLRGESKELARLRDQKSAEHKIQKERAFLFGSNPKGISGGTPAQMEAMTDANGNTVRTTMGIVSALKQYGTTSGDYQNVFASTAVDTYSEFVDAMEKVFQYVPVSGMKRAFVGAGALGYWSKLSGSAGFAGDSGWTVNIGDMKRDALGFNYRVLETPHGALQLIPTPAFRGPYNKHMLIVNDDNLFHAQYRRPQFQASIQANDFDGVKDQYMSDEGIGISLLDSHALMVTP